MAGVKYVTLTMVNVITLKELSILAHVGKIPTIITVQLVCLNQEYIAFLLVRRHSRITIKMPLLYHRRHVTHNLRMGIEKWPSVNSA